MVVNNFFQIEEKDIQYKVKVKVTDPFDIYDPSKWSACAALQLSQRSGHY